MSNFMYTRPGWQEDDKLLASAHARPGAVDCHEGNVTSFLRRHERAAKAAAHRGQQGLIDIGPLLLKRVADARNLRLAWDFLKRNGGHAPGPNGLTYAELEDTEVWELVRTLGQAILAGAYQPGPARRVRIPKSSGQGKRTLELQNVEDRTIQRAVVQIIQPLLDDSFDDNSDGYRPHRGRQLALARALHSAHHDALWVWVVEDIKDAFNHVPLNRLMNVIRKRLPNAGELWSLIEKVVARDSKKGLRQGSALSPLLLNLYLDHFLDRVWRKRNPRIPLLRTADDLLVLCCDEGEARKAYGDLHGILLPTAMILKGNHESAIRVVASGDNVEWLGYEISKAENWTSQDETSGNPVSKDDGLQIRIGEHCWAHLDDHLAVAHTKEGAPLRATQILMGWIGQLGPTYAHEDKEEVYTRIAAKAREWAFTEVPEEEELSRHWQLAHARWCRLKSSISVPVSAQAKAAPPATRFLADRAGAMGHDAPSLL